MTIWKRKIMQIVIETDIVALNVLIIILIMEKALMMDAEHSLMGFQIMHMVVTVIKKL